MAARWSWVADIQPPPTPYRSPRRFAICPRVIGYRAKSDGGWLSPAIAISDKTYSFVCAAPARNTDRHTKTTAEAENPRRNRHRRQIRNRSAIGRVI